MKMPRSCFVLSALASTVVLPACGDGGGGDEASCSAPGSICTIAGRGVDGDGADGLPATDTRLSKPMDTALSPDGRVIVLDWNNHRIRRIEADGTMKIVAGLGELGPDWDNPEADRLNHMTDVTFDAEGRMVVAAWHNSKVKRFDLGSGELVDTCGTGKRGFDGDGGPAEKAVLDLPSSVAYGKDGNLYFMDQANRRIRRVTADGTINTWAGVGPSCPTGVCDPAELGDGGPASMAGLIFSGGQAALPQGKIAFDSAGSLYVADSGHHRVRKIAPDGTISTVAGTGAVGSSGDGGPATAAQLYKPADVAIGPDDTLYIADTFNDCVRHVKGDGTIETVAGICCTEDLGTEAVECPLRTNLGDGGPAKAAALRTPFGVNVGPDGTVYVADTLHHRIRKVVP